jgi:hypothetical protein
LFFAGNSSNVKIGQIVPHILMNVDKDLNLNLLKGTNEQSEKIQTKKIKIAVISVNHSNNQSYYYYYFY